MPLIWSSGIDWPIQESRIDPRKFPDIYTKILGDPKQLPATVISKFAQYSGYGTSRFQRLQKVGYPVDMLKTQYCMRPERRSFPSKEFYQDALEDGADIELRQLLTDINTVALTRNHVPRAQVKFSPSYYISIQLQSKKKFKYRFKEMVGAEAGKVVDIATLLMGFSVVKRVVPSRPGPDRCGLSLVRVTAGQARAESGLQKLGPSPPRQNAQYFTDCPAGCEPKGAPIDF
ncbi:hypothetical protein F2Q69_00059960 [Brassica cretica]|uniref:DNA2/NAM7 helicase-like C-terminal domain-containing protein n=1 Tax=Brassica cretica TaxID=69181 RepID=A0A8S9RFK2_BRACR|nr:hypothetical protein F2Q69_00059960 [Brassica cretica]